MAKNRIAASAGVSSCFRGSKMDSALVGFRVVVLSSSKEPRVLDRDPRLFDRRNELATALMIKRFPGEGFGSCISVLFLVFSKMLFVVLLLVFQTTKLSSAVISNGSSTTGRDGGAS